MVRTGVSMVLFTRSCACPRDARPARAALCKKVLRVRAMVVIVYWPSLMKNRNLNDLPKFDQLPAQPGAPPESSWGVFGEDYALGCLNFLTPTGVVDAARLVQTGKVFRLDAKLGFAKPPLFGRAEMAH